jgi:hypothetical protein
LSCRPANRLSPPAEAGLDGGRDRRPAPVSRRAGGQRPAQNFATNGDGRPVEELQFQNSWEPVLLPCYDCEAPGRIFRSPTWKEKLYRWYSYSPRGYQDTISNQTQLGYSLGEKEGKKMIQTKKNFVSPHHTTECDLFQSPEAHTKRQATQHDCLSSLLGDRDTGI